MFNPSKVYIVLNILPYLSIFPIITRTTLSPIILFNASIPLRQTLRSASTSECNSGASIPSNRIFALIKLSFHENMIVKVSGS